MEEKTFKKINQQVEEKIEDIMTAGIKNDNIDMLGMLVDIHKDLANEEYWEEKKEVMEMRYREGGSYGNYPIYGRRSRDSRGRYTERGMMHEGDEMLEEMREHYGRYMESGRYNGPEKDKAFDYMLQSAEDFFMHLMEEAEHPEQLEKIKKLDRKISEMRM